MLVSLLFCILVLCVTGKDNAFHISPKTSGLLGTNKVFLSTRKYSLMALNNLSSEPIHQSSTSYYWDSNYSLSTFDAGSVTLLLIAVNCFMFLLQRVIPTLTQKLLKNDFYIARGQVYRLLTSTFMHVNLRHLMANSASLYSIGSVAETILGPLRFAIIYLTSGVIGNIVTYAAGTSPNSLGASGSVFGVMGAYASLCYRNRHRISNWKDILAGMGRVLFFEMIALQAFRRSGTDNMGHIGGFLGGVISEILIRWYLQRSSMGPSPVHGLVGRINQLLKSLDPFRRPPDQTIRWL